METNKPMTLEEKHAIIEKIAVTLWKKYWSSEYGMTKDLFTLALQDEIVKTLPDCQSQTASLQSELEATKAKLHRLENALRELLHHSIDTMGLPKKATAKQLYKAQKAL